MEAGDWFFYVVIIASVVGSVLKSVRKKQADVAAQHEEPGKGVPHDGSEWVKNVLRETTKSLFDVDDDDFIPRNPKPSPAAGRPSATQQGPERTAHPSASPAGRTTTSTGREVREPSSAETFCRPNLSAERYTRPVISLEEPATGTSRSTVKFKSREPIVETTPATETPILSAADDLSDIEDVRKAIIYGEIMRPKF